MLLLSCYCTQDEIGREGKEKELCLFISSVVFQGVFRTATDSLGGLRRPEDVETRRTHTHTHTRPNRQGGEVEFYDTNISPLVSFSLSLSLSAVSIKTKDIFFIFVSENAAVVSLSLNMRQIILNDTKKSC